MVAAGLDLILIVTKVEDRIQLKEAACTRGDAMRGCI